MNIQSTMPHAKKMSPLKKQKGDKKPPKEPKRKISGDTITGVGLGMGGSVLGAGYPSIWLHEMGHAKMIDLLYDVPKPEVSVDPFKGGVTRWYPGKLSEIGERVGENGARALVSAAGTMVDVGVATASFGVGFKLRKKHPILGAALMGFGGMTILNSIGYASTAVGGNLEELAKKGNDFASLGVRIGLHPLASIAILASIIPLEYALLRWLESKPDDKNPPDPRLQTPDSSQFLK